MINNCTIGILPPPPPASIAVVHKLPPSATVKHSKYNMAKIEQYGISMKFGRKFSLKTSEDNVVSEAKKELEHDRCDSQTQQTHLVR